jgi:hypothetical protein
VHRRQVARAADFAALIKAMPSESDIRKQVQSVRKISKEMSKMGKDAKAME